MTIVNDILQNALAYSNTVLSTNQLTAIVRANQGGKQPSYPYGSYLITSKENFLYNNRKEIINLDPTKYSEKYFRRENINVSLTLVGKEIQKLYQIADTLYDYLNVISKDFQLENKIKIELLSQIQDRTQFFDPEYEHRLGFDFQVRKIGVLENTIPAVNLETTISEVNFEWED